MTSQNQEQGVVELPSVECLVLMSDVHFDSALCARELFREHMDMAVKLGAGVIFGGDFFDAIHGRGDPRRAIGGMREEHAREDYYDAILEDALRFLRPYAEYILALGHGNHETGVAKNASTDLTKRLAKELGCAAIPYRSWIRWGSKTLFFAHGGSRGAAPAVTLGVIDVARTRAWADADVLWHGHTHTAYLLPFVRVRDGERRLGWAVRTPGYYGFRLGSSWTDEQGHAPQPLGCAVLRQGCEIKIELVVR